MGRSRAVSHAADDDSSQSRSKRKRTASNTESLENASNGIGDGKGALYHCNYCNKDISGKIRIKCAVCPDFDLCVECFSVGAEVTPHKSGHPYRVMDNLSFPLICPDWNADEEILLLEGIEMYGLGNWAEVAEHVGTKKKSECIDHYNTVYMDSPCFPYPDLSHVMGKSREELLAMAKEHCDSKKGTIREAKEVSSFTGGIKIEDSRKEGPPNHFSPSVTGGVGSSGGKTSMIAAKRASNMTQDKDSRENTREDSRPERTTGEKKLKLSNDEAPPMTEVNGYNFKRQEFEVEYDNDAEQLLADMEFKDTDTAAEKELKLRILRIYSKRLDERKRRKEFILERGLLYPDPYEKTLSPEEKEIYNKYMVFMRFLAKEEYEDMVKTAIEEHRMLKRIQELQEARAAGCRTSSEAKRYIEQKKKKEAEENARKAKESIPPGPGGNALMRINLIKGESEVSPRNSPRGSMVLESGSRDLHSPNVGHSLTSCVDMWDVTGFPGADLLSDAEKKLCSEILILPAHYLSMMQTISIGMLSGSITQKADAHPLFKADSSKVDRVYDELLKKGFTPH